MEGASQIINLNKIIIASSMLVCKLGYVPISFDDYQPNSLYGESKVITEKIVKEYKNNWIIVRPTSIWGPWFSEPYKIFFDMVIKGRYFNIPREYASNKTYGYVENSCMQIISLLINNNENTIHNYFYIGDYNPINITDWAIKIRKLNKQTKPLTLPIGVLKVISIIGDFLKSRFGWNSFPMNSFRFKNMTNNNIIEDLQRTIDKTNIGLNTNLDEEIIKTLNWLKQYKN
jgi:nucleoside-diphosphate-sugar epimerase